MLAVRVPESARSCRCMTAEQPQQRASYEIAVLDMPCYRQRYVGGHRGITCHHACCAVSRPAPGQPSGSIAVGRRTVNCRWRRLTILHEPSRPCYGQRAVRTGLSGCQAESPACRAWRARLSVHPSTPIHASSLPTSHPHLYTCSAQHVKYCSLHTWEAGHSLRALQGRGLPECLEKVRSGRDLRAAAMPGHGCLQS